jgi:cell division protein FtsL
MANYYEHQGLVDALGSFNGLTLLIAVGTLTALFVIWLAWRIRRLENSKRQENREERSK